MSLALLFGSTGWIGGKMTKLLEKEGWKVQAAISRLEDLAKVKNEVMTVKPDRVVIAAGLTGRPNIDWCEDHKDEVNRVNVVGTIYLVDLCYKLGIHTTFFGTGCIYEYDDTHPIGGKGFTETDQPNFDKSYYSLTKIMVQESIKDKCLLLRIRMPLSDDLHPRNFITKIKNYPKVVNVPNSMTVLHDLLPVAVDLINKKVSGVFNLTNPGVIDHNTILGLYRDYIDPDYKWVNFSLAEQSKILKAGRSNNCMDSSKLLKLYPDIPDITTSIVKLFERMKKLEKKTE